MRDEDPVPAAILMLAVGIVLAAAVCIALPILFGL